ncbi:MAG: 5-bromo-4-chloroindolyl phosphate hydrolysis family protein [Rubrimonas sp.]
MNDARRYGGPHSPGGSRGPASSAGAPADGGRPTSPWAGRRATSVSLRGIVLLLLPTPLLLGAAGALISADPARLAGFIGAYAALLAGAGLTRTGLAAEAAYRARAVARPPAFPRKLFGAALTALGVAAAGLLGGAAFASAAGMGALAAALHVVAFGPDPMRSKGLDGLSGAALEEAATRLETARRLIGEMVEAAARFEDRELSRRVGALAAEAEAVVAQLERDPAGLGRARRFLAVYLVGARDAAVKYAQSWDESRDPAIAARYGALLEDLSAQFADHRKALAAGDRAALEIEIDVLRDRLKLEGV